MDEVRRSVVDEGLTIAREVGWNARILHYDDERFELMAKQTRLPFLHASAPALPAGAATAERLPPPWIVGLRSFAAILGCRSGHATVLAPIGCYASPLRAGAIDAVVIAPERDDDSCGHADWTCSYASIGHTRCWIVNVVATASCPTDVDLQRRVVATDRLVRFPKWMAIRDTATLSEYARDCGRMDARFPDIVVLDAKPAGCESKAVVIAWLAMTDVAVSVVLAERIGAAMEPDLSADERYRKIKANLGAGVGGRS